MARSSALIAIAGNAHAQWGLLIDVADIPTTLQLTTLDDQPADFTAYRAWLMSTVTAIGPELDWRGGLAADEPFSVTVQNGLASATGTGTSNTFERWFALFAHDAYAAGAQESVLLNGGSGDVTVKLASYDGTPTGQSTTIFTGKTRNVAMDDYVGMQLEFGSATRALLDRAYLTRLGREPAGYENYDTVVGRPIVDQSDGQAVPIVYGIIPYAEGLFVHEESTQDETARSGLILCFSDIRFNTLQNDGKLNQPFLAVYDPATDELYDVMDEDLESGTTGQTQYSFIYVDAGAPETNLVGSGAGGTAPATGYIVKFTAADDAPPADEPRPPRLAGGGRILIRRRTPMLKPAQNRQGDSGGGDMWADLELGADDDDTTFAESSNAPDGGTDDLLGSNRAYTWLMPELTGKGIVYRAYLLPKYAHSGTAGDQRIRAFYYDGSAQVGSSDGAGGGDYESGSSWNSWTGASSAFRFQFAPSPTAEVSPSGLSRGGRTPIWLGTFPGVTALVETTAVYGADFDVWWDVDWTEYRNKIYAYVSGVRDDTYELESGTGETLRNPAEIFWHFCAEVAGLPVDSSNLAAVAAQMAAHGLLLDAQLTDGDEPAKDFLDRLAQQFMCHIFENDDGEQRMVYRPGQVEPVNYDDPITMADVVKGTFRTRLTDADELYAGVIVNYAWNAPRGKYEGQWAITPTGHEIETNVTSPSEYQGLADMVDVDRERILEVNADLIQDADTAELLCKWLIQQHCRRRQIIEFETFLERFGITAGDVICVDTPHIRIFGSASGAAATAGTPDGININGATKFPVSNVGDATHRGDYLIVESGAQAGHYVIEPFSGAAVYVLYDDVTVTTGAMGPLRIIPTFDVLSAKVVYDKQKGPRIAIKAVEHPIIRAGATDI